MTYTSSEVAELLHVRDHWIGYLVEKGVVEPVIHARGRGTVWRFSLDEVLLVAVALELQRCGATVKHMAHLASFLEEVGMHLPGEGQGEGAGSFLFSKARNAPSSVELRLVDRSTAVLCLDGQAFAIAPGGACRPLPAGLKQESWLSADLKGVASGIEAP